MRRRSFFNSHLIDTNITYGRHMARAVFFGIQSLIAAKIFFIHSIFPFLFKETGGEIIKKLYEKMKTLDADNSFRCGAVAIVINEDKKALVLKRSNEVGTFKGYWNFPSGAVDPGELEIEAAARECYEESGISISKEDMAFVTEFLDNNAGVNIHYFITNKYNGEPAINWESTEFLWLDIDDIFNDLRDDFVPVPDKLHELIGKYIASI